MLGQGCLSADESFQSASQVFGDTGRPQLRATHLGNNSADDEPAGGFFRNGKPLPW